ncbi:MAG: hypothetical protein J6N19_18120 [Clostridium sp.]|nr:hypothetical protein [Clostridium sp.]
MKKLISLVLCGLTLFSVCACGQTPDVKTEPVNTEAEIQETGVTEGGWSRAESPDVTDEVKALLDKALDGMVGANYTPVAYLGSQVVAGTNHAILCRVSPVYPDAEETYAIVYLYEDLDGNVEITETVDSNRNTDLSDGELDGGWFLPESPALTDEAKDALEKALDGMVGASYDPIALLSSQVVAGMNYCILCEITPVYPDAESHYALVYVYADLDGSAQITETVDFAAVVEEETVQIPNPFMDYDTLADAAKAAGFELTAPDAVDGYLEKLIQVMNGSMIQIIFRDADENRLFIRKQAGSEDISGDYNSYTEINTVSVDGRQVTMKGENGHVSVAIWTDGAYTYAVTADKPMAQEAMTALVSAVA